MYSIAFLYSISISESPLASSITIPLSRYNSYTIQNSSRSQLQKLSYLVSSSVTRAHHLKSPRTSASNSIIKTSVFSHSYGGYSISMPFGTPPQTVSFVMDTGSSFVWFPCTTHYLCNNCSRLVSPPFIPRHSSSSRIIGCKNPKCSWIHQNQSHLQCRDSQICPPYLILYGSGTTGGIALSETLRLRGLTVQNFAVGCSLFSSRQPAGIAGFGRGPSSLPSQLGLRKFSYCLLSHKFDDTQESSSLVLDSVSDSDEKTGGLEYTPFVENPRVEDKPALSEYYYVSLRRISVGGQGVEIPHRYLSPDKHGNGGTIIDSGTTFTYMSTEAFQILSSAFISQVNYYERALMVEGLSGLKPCFNVSGAHHLQLPQLSLHFKGGADVQLPLENYFASSREVACFTVVTDATEQDLTGPAIILGNFQMQNFHVEYDLKNHRLGFSKESCN